MNGLRRNIVVAALALIAVAGPTAAQEIGGPIRIVVPFAPGTTTDTVGRIVADALGKALKQTVIVENRAGAGGSTGSEAVAKSAADGRTLVMGTVGTHAINASLYRKLPYDPLRDFVPVAFVGYTPTLLVVASEAPVRSLAELAVLAKRPEGVTFASAGNGTSGHLAGEMLSHRIGGRVIHVPYKDGAQALIDVMSAKVDFMFYHPAAVLPHLRAGKLRALGASAAARSAAAPDVPTLIEQGLAEFDLVAWFMLYAPAATPAATLQQLRAAAATALAAADVASRLAAQGIESREMRGDALAAFNRVEVAKWAELVKRSGAQVD